MKKEQLSDGTGKSSASASGKAGKNSGKEPSISSGKRSLDKSPSVSPGKGPAASPGKGSQVLFRKGSPGTFELDQTDIRILNILQQDARLSIREIARKVNLSTTPVHERLKRLESSGIIDHYSAVINTDKISQFIVFFVNIIMKEHSTRLGTKFVEKITSFPEVVEFYTIGGEHDFMIKVMVPDMAAYRLFFVDKLGEVPNIAKLQSIIVLDTIKRGGTVPL